MKGATRPEGNNQELREMANHLIDKHGHDAIYEVPACTPLERVIASEMKVRGVTNIRKRSGSFHRSCLKRK